MSFPHLMRESLMVKDTSLKPEYGESEGSRQRLRGFRKNCRSFSQQNLKRTSDHLVAVTHLAKTVIGEFLGISFKKPARGSEAIAIGITPEPSPSIIWNIRWLRRIHCIRFRSHFLTYGLHLLFNARVGRSALRARHEEDSQYKEWNAK